jgi:tetratricopeptide (TPR) repeat protein
LITWPSQFGDLGAFLFSMLALHEASRQRMRSALPALALALLCKEAAVVTAVLLPFMPGVAGDRPGARARWLAGSGGVLVAWAAAYSWVRSHAGLELPHGLERDSALLATPLPARLGWAWSNSLGAIHSLTARPAPGDMLVYAVLALLIAMALGMVARGGAARERLARHRRWILWGLAWFLLAAASLAPIYPLWAPVRSQFASVGWGICAISLLAVARPALAGVLVGLRLLLLLASPGPPRWITPEVIDRGASVDFGRISRIQLLMEESRRCLTRRFPVLAPGAIVGFRDLPLSTEYAFGSGRAVEAWYADTSLTWVSAPQFETDTSRVPVALIDYQPEQRPQVVLLDPAALLWQKRGVESLTRGEWTEAIAEFDRSDAAQRDGQAVVFLGDTAGRRSYCLAQLRRFPEAEREARRALRASARDTGARLVLAITLAARKANRAALGQLDSLLALSPHDEEALALARQLRETESVGP